MKKKSKLFRIGVVLAVVAVIVVLLEVFDCHPEFSMGRFHSIWVGVRHMHLRSETMTSPVHGGRKVIQRDYEVGPVKIAIMS